MTVKSTRLNLIIGSLFFLALVTIGKFITLGIICIVLFGVAVKQDVLAQFVPLPPPVLGNSSHQSNLISNPADHTPPVIKILSSNLHEGKNVFKVRIEDNSGISSASVKYVHNGQIRTTPLLNQGGSLFSALVDIYPPSRILELQASDSEGNTVNTFREYNVTQNDFLTSLSDLFGGIWNRLSPSQ